MLGAILGDLIGSYYEAHEEEQWEQGQELLWGEYSDDTVLTVATMEALLLSGFYEKVYRTYYRNDPDRGYGERFKKWALSDEMPAYGSFGNGAAMRVSPIGFQAQDENWLEQEVRKSAEVTHDHPEGVKGAMAIVCCIYWLREGKDKTWLKNAVEERFRYDLSTPLKEMHESYRFDASAQGSVPQAICCFLESDSVLCAIGNAIWLGGDMDTIADMAGALAEASYGLDNRTARKILDRLPETYSKTVQDFYRLIIGRTI
jgi:ADP-ribosylglycohydrolase